MILLASVESFLKYLLGFPLSVFTMKIFTFGYFPCLDSIKSEAFGPFRKIYFIKFLTKFSKKDQVLRGGRGRATILDGRRH